MLKRFVNWNIGTSYNSTQTNLGYITDIIRKHNPDYVSLQELLIDDSFISELSSQLRMPHFVIKSLSPSQYMPEKSMGIGLFSKTPLKLKSEVALYNPHLIFSRKGKIEATHDKGFICCTSEDNITIACGHGFPFHRYELNEYSFLEKFYAPLDCWLEDNLPHTAFSCILADLNTNIAEELLPNVFRSMHNIMSAPTRPNGRRDDYIICPSNVVIKEMINEPTLLDHNLCYAALMQAE
jgi:exonuclease III